MRMHCVKKVGKTIAIGQITAPNEWYSVLDNTKYCAVGGSVDITYCLQNGAQICGRLYQSVNNTTTYYQFYIVDPKDRRIFSDHIKSHGTISIDLDLSTRCLYVFGGD